MLHLPTQILHLGNGEARIMSNDDDVRGLEGRVERRDELFLARSIHWILSDRRLSPRRARNPLGCTSRPSFAQRDGASMALPPDAAKPLPVSARTDAGDPEPVLPCRSGRSSTGA